MMDTTKSYKISAKRADTGKFWGFGNLKYNEQYSNWRMGMKVTPELKALISANDGKWINFSLFEENEQKQAPHNEAKANAYQPVQQALGDSDIPF